MLIELQTTELSQYIKNLVQATIAYSPKIISAAIILVIGIYAIRMIKKIIQKIMQKRQFEPTLTNFLTDILIWVLRLLLFVTLISKLGIDTSSFVAILGAMGLAIGMSLQGSLSNFAGGLLIVTFKPFRVGDTIEAQGMIATVNQIQIFVTKLTTANNQIIFIPNGALSNGTIINYSIEGKRRADLTISISYDTDLKTAKNILLDVLNNHPKVLQDPKPEVVVKNLTDTAVQLAVRPWANNADFSSMVSEVLENCKSNFDHANISFQPIVKEHRIA